ncbi:MAG: trigger factor [Myxococcota bacterium]|nr:trigger factor [Myxococcota bacterium]
MQFDLKIENVSQSRCLLKFTIDKKEVSAALDKAYSRVGQNLKLQGYRKGKAPRWLLERRFKKNVEAEVVDDFIQNSYRNADIPHTIVGQPSVEDLEGIKKNKALSFSLGVDIRPEFTVENYTGIEVPYSEPALEDGELEAAIDRRLASKKKIEDAPEGKEVEEGDFVLAKIQFTVDGETVADESGTMLHIGSEKFYPGIDSLLIGSKKGESKEGEVTISEESVFDHLKGKSGDVSVEVINVQSYTQPDLNDELAAELGFANGVDEFKASVEEEILQARRNGARDQARVKILESLESANDFEVPSAMVEEQLKALMEELKMRRMYAGEDPRKIQFAESEMEDLQRRARFAAKCTCLLSLIAKQEKIDVEDADIEAKIAEIAGMRNQTPESIRSYIQSENAFGVLSERILEEKTINWLFENSALVSPEPQEE